MNNLVKNLFFLVMIALFLTTCEYEESEEGDKSSDSYRITTIKVDGEVDDMNSETYYYNDDGYISMIVRRDADDNTETVQYMYDDEGNVTSETRVQDGVAEMTINEFVDGFKVSSETTTDGGVILEKVKYYYDTKGFLTKKEILDPSNAIRGTVSFSYENETVKGVGKEISEYTLISQ